MNTLSGHESSVLCFLAQRPDDRVAFDLFKVGLRPFALSVAEYIVSKGSSPIFQSDVYSTGDAIIRWARERVKS